MGKGSCFRVVSDIVEGVVVEITQKAAISGGRNAR